MGVCVWRVWGFVRYVCVRMAFCCLIQYPIAMKSRSQIPGESISITFIWCFLGMPGTTFFLWYEVCGCLGVWGV